LGRNQKSVPKLVRNPETIRENPVITPLVKDPIVSMVTLKSGLQNAISGGTLYLESEPFECNRSSKSLTTPLTDNL
jgi:hypothetical protein